MTAGDGPGPSLSSRPLGPPGAAAHGEELVGGTRSTAGKDVVASFETVRLSTVFDAHGAPVKAGAELFRPGEELPSRIADGAAGAIDRGRRPR